MPTQITHLSKSIKFALTSAAAASLAVSLNVSAQEDDSNAAETGPVEKIAIVGTRAAPRSVGDSAVPLDIIGADEFAAQGATDMMSMMSTVVPSFNVNDQPINDASTLVRPANLRGLASDHTLVLVNGKRRHRSAVITFLGGSLSDGAQGPDISNIPAVALKQVEVLRDGAAAQYGSDAIAGVINFVLKDDADGGMIEARWGETMEGDGDTLQVAGNIGLPLTDDGFANFSMEYREADATSRSVQRDDAAALAAGGNPDIENPAQIWGTPKIKYDFKLVGNFGLDLGNDKEAYMFTNWAEREIDGGFYYRNPHTRGGVYSGGIEPADLNGDGVIDEDEGHQLLLVGDLTDDMSANCPTDIRVGDNVLDNPRYISEVANNPDCWAFNEMFPGGFTPRFGGIVTDASIAMGTKGYTESEWFYDISIGMGYSQIEYSIRNTVNPSLGPNTPTEFAPGTASQLEQNFNFDVSRLFEMDSLYEPLAFAAGIEYRRETFKQEAGDPASFAVGSLAFNPATGTSQGFGIGSNGFPGIKPEAAGEWSRGNWAGFVDVEAYVTENLMIGAAARYEDFTDFGSTFNGKLSARLQMTDTFAIRGAVSTGFKAPTVGQSNVINVTTAFVGTQLQDQALLPPTNPIAALKGGEPLEPEDSVAYSFGLVGEFENGLYLTIDYFNVEVTDRLSRTSAIPLTQEDIDALLAQGIRDATSFSSVVYFTNDFDTTTQGIDVVMNYSNEVFGGDMKYSLAYNWTDTTVDDFNPDNINLAKVEMLEDNLPAHRGTYTMNWSKEDFRALMRLNYFGEYYEDHVDAGGGLDIYPGSELTVDLELGYFLTDDFQIAGGAKNLFDNVPDDNPFAGVVGSKYPTTAPMGINGGFYYIRGIYTF
ncbi:TonB-dependent receptor plug domain-containing protein [Lacimicrobium alkaliphilum]|uniref:TonB-dependent receptor n=1 Tax=Lacimicrobium alkaliphilum TaxID=1526571 RepID=A0ABQ1RFD6_9ALTE|nr:TonB-dependent receptor [Lacimicrobium alkaliphilum]GGD68711.1 TonB-dependent receptor [Lacimicrobium alkaliphilum]